MTVNLQFRPSSRNPSKKGSAGKDSAEGSAGEAATPDRTLKKVPMQEAWHMALGFARYNRGGLRRRRHQTYRYLKAGEEVEVELDFREITALEVLYDQEEEGPSTRLLRKEF